MIWDRDGRDWPNREHSRFHALGKLRWHLQEAGDTAQPTILLLHGTGAATHTWRHIFKPLAEIQHVLALDLPGQGFTFTSDTDQCGLKEMSKDIAALLANLACDPAIIIGHSAGAAIAYQLALDLPQTPRRVVSINGAMEPFSGLAGAVLPFSAKLMTVGAIGANLVALTMSSESAVRRLIEATGSEIDAAGIAYYRRLVADTGHVNATIEMMARWNLDTLLTRAAEIRAESLLIVGGRDRAVAQQTSTRWAKRLAQVETISLPTCGHLPHEEDNGSPILAHLHQIIR